MGKISVGIYLSYEATTQQGMDNQQIKAGSLIYCLFFHFRCNCKLLEGEKQATPSHRVRQRSVSTVLNEELLPSAAL